MTLRVINVKNLLLLPSILRNHAQIDPVNEEFVKDVSANWIKLQKHRHGLSPRELAWIVLLELEKPVGERRPEHIWRPLAWIADIRRDHEWEMVERVAADPKITIELKDERHG